MDQDCGNDWHARRCLPPPGVAGVAPATAMGAVLTSLCTVIGAVNATTLPRV
ncbi:MAG: hypothetical protein ACE5E8_06260 [Acidimicrobiia bacterium]